MFFSCLPVALSQYFSRGSPVTSYDGWWVIHGLCLHILLLLVHGPSIADLLSLIISLLEKKEIKGLFSVNKVKLKSN